MRCPNTPFATRLSGSAKETQLRLRSIFQWKKQRPPVWLFAAIAVVILGCMGLVSCEQPSTADETLTLTTSDGKQITVELDLEPTPWDERCCAVTQLRVMEDKQLLQTIEPDDLIAEFDIDGLYFLRGYVYGEADIRDFNFDSSEDFSLLCQSILPKNPPHLFFLWSEEEQQFKASFIMTGLPEVDVQQQQIVEKMAGYRRRYYVYQDGVIQEIPASVKTMALVEKIGKTFDRFSDMTCGDVAIPDASGQCMYDEENGVGYYFFGTQGMPGLPYLPKEYTRRLRCAGIVSTVGELFPQITEGMLLYWFCDTFEITDYTYGYEDAPDQGWLRFDWEGYTIWIDTDDPVTESYDPTAVGVDVDDVILIVDEAREKENYQICEEYWNEIIMAELREL